jgi:hypothetical protein
MSADDLRKAHLSLLVFFLVLAVGLAIIGLEHRDVEYQLVVVIAFGSAFTTLFSLYHREDRARERSAARSRGRDKTTDDETD